MRAGQVTGNYVGGGDRLSVGNRLVQLELFHLRLPFRQSFRHAAAERDATETVVAAAHLADGTIGWGEGLPREYVTGETIESVLYNITEVPAVRLGGVEPASFTEVLEAANELPFSNGQGQVINAARCCVELAVLDAYGKYFGTDLSSITGWMGHPALTGALCERPPGVSGVLGSGRAREVGRRLRLMRLYGLRDFKLKLGCEDDEANLELVHRRLGRALRRGRATLRVDANGAWDIDAAVGMSHRLADFQVCCLEQPLAPTDRSHWATLADLTAVPLMADESLVTLADAEYLGQNDLVDFFNIRISKNGGLIPALRLAALAGQYSRGFQLGAMVGETGILAAAGRRFLQMVPQASFTEICYAGFLLREDIVEPEMRFRYGGRLSKLAGAGLGVTVQRSKLEQFLVQPVRKMALG